MGLFRKKNPIDITKYVPIEVHEQIVKNYRKRVKAQHAMLFMAAKANGGKLVIPKVYVEKHKSNIGGIELLETEVPGGKIIQAIDHEIPSGSD